MATDTVVSDHPAAVEQVKEEELEQVKTVKEEVNCEPKESIEETITKAEDPPSVEAPLVESKDLNGDNKAETTSPHEEKTKTDDSPIQPPVSEETCEEKETEPAVVQEVAIADGEEKASTEVEIHDKETELPVAVEVQKSRVEEELKAEDLPSVGAPLSESKDENEEKVAECPVTEEIEKKDVEEARESAEVIEDKNIEPPVVNKKEEQPVIASEAVADQTTEKKEEEPVVVPEAVAETTEKKEEEKTVVEDSVDATAEKKEDEPKVECLTEEPKTVEKSNKLEDLFVKEKEPALVKDETVPAVEEKPEIKSMITEEADAGKTTITEERTKIEEAVADVKEGLKAEDVAELSNKIEEVATENVAGTVSNTEESAENVKQDVKEEAVALVESIGDGAIKNTTDEAVGTVADTKEPEEETKGEETVETEKTVPKEQESVDDAKTTTEDLPKGEEEVKSTQKQSNGILGKVKKSLIKAKKAIIGKNTNSKTLPPETNDEVKV